MRVFNRLAWGSAVCVAGLAFGAAGNPLVYEPFNYAAGVDGLNGQSGGTGFDGAWDAAGSDVTSPGFTYTDAGGRVLQTTGNKAYVDSTTVGGTSGSTIQQFRGVDAALNGVTGGTLYVSMLAQKLENTPRYVNLALFSGTAESIAIGHGTGNGNSNWGAYTGGTGTNGAYSNVPANDLSFLVLRVDLNANGANERVRLYVNPNLDAEPGTANVDFNDRDALATFDQLTRVRLSAGGSNASGTAAQLLVDEVRIGTSFADVAPAVAPVPEPAALGLAGAVAAGMLGRRRRR